MIYIYIYIYIYNGVFRVLQVDAGEDLLELGPEVAQCDGRRVLLGHGPHGEPQTVRAAQPEIPPPPPAALQILKDLWFSKLVPAPIIGTRLPISICL